MAVINLAYSAPINPTGALPVLTKAQVWNGLKHKVRRAQDFVPVIVDCQVLSEEATETGEKMTRKVTFAPGFRSDDAPVTETVFQFAPSRINFHQEDGSTVSNIISAGPDGDLILTYAFEWRYPDVVEGSEEAKRLEDKNWNMSKVAVEGSINTIRRLVEEGKL
ncbi:hypothetical protein FZEAL_246 [Fusarium zealandicum]|uniref:DUF1857-domain-containing protein n=1 Tax=Fusarium zealandicum TaxID=1053134 RepID=A0A8H4XR14_9HYPO|nr:hypothetical protein FZEAL_246 [Fusarium zealandicum]